MLSSISRERLQGRVRQAVVGGLCSQKVHGRAELLPSGAPQMLVVLHRHHHATALPFLVTRTGAFCTASSR